MNDWKHVSRRRGTRLKLAPKDAPLVVVPQGRWKGRVGRVVGEHYNSGSDRQQSQSYPVVELEPTARARGRIVTVLAVKPVSDGDPTHTKDTP